MKLFRFKKIKILIILIKYILKSKTNEHGSNVTDSSPIVKIKGALQKLRVFLIHK